MRPPGREGVITAEIAREVSACLTILGLWTEEEWHPTYRTAGALRSSSLGNQHHQLRPRQLAMSVRAEPDRPSVSFTCRYLARAHARLSLQGGHALIGTLRGDLNPHTRDLRFL